MALLAVCLDLSAVPLCVQAEDAADAPAAEEAAAEAPATEAAAADAPAEGGEEVVVGAEGVVADEAKGQEFVDSARELQEKLGQLRALLDAKGEGADPALKERLAGLEKQLGGLGLDGLTGAAAGSSPELTEFLSACVAMSLRRAGMQRPATLGALRKLVQKKLPPAEAAHHELWKMVAVCVTECKEDEFAGFKSGKLKILPKVYVDAAKEDGAVQKVLEIEEPVWEELRKISEGLLAELVGNTEETSKLPGGAGMFAMIPFIGVIGLMVWGFFRMQKDADDTKAKKAAKKERKAPDSGKKGK